VCAFERPIARPGSHIATTATAAATSPRLTTQALDTLTELLTQVHEPQDLYGREHLQQCLVLGLNQLGLLEPQCRHALQQLGRLGQVLPAFQHEGLDAASDGPFLTPQLPALSRESFDDLAEADVFLFAEAELFPHHLGHARTHSPFQLHPLWHLPLPSPAPLRPSLRLQWHNDE